MNFGHTPISSQYVLALVGAISQTDVQETYTTAVSLCTIVVMVSQIIFAIQSGYQLGQTDQYAFQEYTVLKENMAYLRELQSLLVAVLPPYILNSSLNVYLSEYRPQDSPDDIAEDIIKVCSQDNSTVLDNLVPRGGSVTVVNGVMQVGRSPQAESQNIHRAIRFVSINTISHLYNPVYDLNSPIYLICWLRVMSHLIKVCIDQTLTSEQKNSELLDTRLTSLKNRIYNGETGMMTYLYRLWDASKNVMYSGITSGMDSISDLTSRTLTGAIRRLPYRAQDYLLDDDIIVSENLPSTYVYDPNNQIYPNERMWREAMVAQMPLEERERILSQYRTSRYSQKGLRVKRLRRVKRSRKMKTKKSKKVMHRRR